MATVKQLDWLDINDRRSCAVSPHTTYQIVRSCELWFSNELINDGEYAEPVGVVKGTREDAKRNCQEHFEQRTLACLVPEDEGA